MADLDILNKLGSKPSASEENGLSKLRSSDKVIFSPGISTAGFAEIRMAEVDPERKIIATTIDQKGLDFAKEVIKQTGFEHQIETKIEDLSGEWKYSNEYFDFIYARLVLHYLSFQDLNKVLKKFYNSLKPTGKLFVVVRSIKNVNQDDPNVKFDSTTKFTTVTYYSQDGTIEGSSKRYFHTAESITSHLEDCGFIVEEIKEYQERLYKDFMRMEISPVEDYIIELLCSKKI